VFVNGQPVGKTLDFLIDHEASGLTPPDPSLQEIGEPPYLEVPGTGAIWRVTRTGSTTASR
jgi:hypothetical protein